MLCLAMKLVTFVVFFGLVQSNPIICWNSVFSNVYQGDSSILQDKQRIVKKSVTEQCPSKLQDIGNLEEPSKLSLSTVESLTYDEDTQERAPDLFVPIDIKPPMIPSALPSLWNDWPHYDSNYIKKSDLNTNEDIINQMLPYISASPVPSVNLLPPVMSTQIHEYIPHFEDNYDIEDFDLENVVYGIPNVRAVRSRDDEFLGQLKHDAMIPNIIPTMPVPFVKAADSPMAYQGPIRANNAALYYFPGSAPDRTLPYLFSCSSKLVFERFASDADGVHPVISPTASPEHYKTSDVVKSNGF